MSSTLTVDDLYDIEQFTIPQVDKERVLLDALRDLTAHHEANCPPYQRVLEGLAHDPASVTSLPDLPYLPVSLFKQHYLASIPDAEVFKTMTSSGTTGQAVSRIILDRETAARQSQALAAIMRKVLGDKRLPMIVIDTKNVVKDRNTFSARGAGVLGMIQYGRKHFYALNDDMSLDVEGLRAFLAEYGGQPMLMFGFTFMVWKHFLQQIRDLDLDVDFSQGVLIHSGGWKKLVEEAVSNQVFKRAFRETTGLTRVHNFYGMVEQVGSVFLEGDDGFLYPPNFADVIIRNPQTWEVAEIGEVGLVEVLSVLPRSYPGHVLLTEDLGVVHGIGDVATGWSGKQLEIIGRVPKAELRGCSDTHAADFTAAR
ncbi:acyl-protein synthetase [Micrococcales bacterium 31B]|nr:acyl-protein synthetase [Micrococcales bacterium 31B]